MQFVGILALLLGGAAASCLVQGYRAAPSIYDLAVGRIAARRVRSVAVILLLVPLVVVLVVTGLLLFVWHTDPLLRYSHMIWVLALWMVGTLGMYSVFLASHLGLPRLRYMFAGVLAIPLAIYSTPLTRFRAVFGSAVGVFAALFGFGCLLTCVLLTLRMWRAAGSIQPEESGGA